MITRSQKRKLQEKKVDAGSETTNETTNEVTNKTTNETTNETTKEVTNETTNETNTKVNTMACSDELYAMRLLQRDVNQIENTHAQHWSAASTSYAAYAPSAASAACARSAVYTPPARMTEEDRERVVRNIQAERRKQDNEYLDCLERDRKREAEKREKREKRETDKRETDKRDADNSGSASPKVSASPKKVSHPVEEFAVKQPLTLDELRAARLAHYSKK